MESIQFEGHVDDQNRLSANVPGSIPPGPVTVWVVSAETEEDPAGASWAAGVAHDWAEELNDSRQDIYNVTDGDALD